MCANVFRIVPTPQVADELRSDVVVGLFAGYAFLNAAPSVPTTIAEG